MTRNDNLILAKLRDAGIKNLSPAEVGRAFRNVVSLPYCVNRVSELVEDGLTIQDIYPANVFVDGILSLALLTRENTFVKLLCADGITRNLLRWQIN